LRTVLTIIALILASALTVALVAPYYIDWNKQRAVIEAQLSRLSGAHVAVKGSIDLKLLPSPYVTLNQVEIRDQKTGDALFSCDEMELALGLTSLARGQFRFTQASFDHPTIDLARSSDGGIALPKLDLAKRSDSIAFDKVVVRNGSVRIAGGNGSAELDANGVNLDAEADSLLGPFKGSGEIPGPGGAKVTFNFATGSVEDGGLRLKAVVDAGSRLPRSEFDGALALTAATPISGVLTVGYTGAASFSGVINGPNVQIPWRASGTLKADLRKASLDDLDVRLGQEDRALAANGSGQMEFGAAPRVSATLAAKQLNFDALLRGQGEDTASPTKAFDALSAAFGGLEIEGGPPVALSVEFGTPAAILGGDTIADVALTAEAGPSAPINVKFEASPPGRSHILASGVIDAGLAPDFKGRVDVRIDDMPRLRDWLTQDSPDWSARLGAIEEILPYRSASAVGNMDVSTAGFFARDMNLVLARSTFTGTLAVTRAVGAERGRVFLDLRTDSLDIDALPNVGATEDFLSGVDLSLNLVARAVRVARIGETEVEGGALALKLAKQGGEIRLDHLSIANLGGASVEANGESGAKGRSLSAKIDAASLRDFALLARRVAPGPISQMLVDRSAALSPAKLVLSAQSSPSNGNDADLGDSLTVQGAAGVTRVDAKKDRAAGPAGALNAKISLDAPDAAPLLRQLGLPASTIAGVGLGHVSASVRGRWADGLEADMSASFAGADFVWRGRFSPNTTDADHTLFNGSSSVKAANSIPLLMVLGIAPPELPLAVPTDLSAKLIWRDDRLSLSQLQGTVGRTRFAGDLTYRPAPAQPTSPIPTDLDVALAQAVVGDNSKAPAPQLEGALQLDRLSLSAVTGLALGAPQPAKAGVLWSDAVFPVGLINPPTAEIALKIGALDITDNILAHDAGARLKLARGLVGLDDFSMNVAGARVTGHATIRRDGANASLSGQASVEPISFDRPNFAGEVSGAMDFASTGQTANGLVAGLAGSGQIHLGGIKIPRLDQRALGRIVDKAQSSDYAIDQVNISHALDQEFAKQALRVPDANAPATLTAGIIRLGPFDARNARDDAQLRASFDLRSFVLEIRAAFTELQTTKYWSGSPPTVNVVLQGPIESSARDIDSGLFAAGLAAQALARETERIGVLESDIRERAFFNRRLKADQFIRRRELELEAYAVDQARLKSEQDRRRVEMETLKAYEDRRNAGAPPDQLAIPASPGNGASQSLMNVLPPIVQRPLPIPRPPSASQHSDPTATGLY
jgi:uncharacterized protein involved in outer membrane biogenesis